MLTIYKSLIMLLLTIPLIGMAADNGSALIKKDTTFETGGMAPDYKKYMGDIKLGNPTGHWDLVTSVVPTALPEVQMDSIPHSRPYIRAEGYQSITPEQRRVLLAPVRGF